MNDDRKPANRPRSSADRRAAITGLPERRAARGGAAKRAGRNASAEPESFDDALDALERARHELAAVRAERDRLQRELAQVGAMQTETLALGAEEAERNVPETLPTLDDLMAGLETYGEGARDKAYVQAEPEGGIMLAPELLFTSDDEPSDLGGPPIAPAPSFGPWLATASLGAAAPARVPARVPAEAPAEQPAPASAPAVARAPQVAVNSRLLVFVDAEPPIKYPLYKRIMTIGRSETADIRIDGDYISRVHARVTTAANGDVIVEDVASKNGIRVNGKAVKLHGLRHGDVLSLGKLHFTFIDTTAAAQE